MRNGFLLMLALWPAAGSVLGQMPYPGMAPGGYPQAPLPAYGPPAGYGYGYPYYPQPAPYPPAWPTPPSAAYYPPAWQQPIVAGPYNPYPVNPKTVTAKSSPAAGDAKPPAACPCRPPTACPCEPLVCPPPATPIDEGTETKAHGRLLPFVAEPLWVTAEKLCSCFDQPPPPCAPGGYPWYGRSEVLYFWLQNQSIPGTTSLGNTGSSIAVPGYTSVSLDSVFPHYNDLIAASHLGGRLTLGRWLDEDQYWGLEATAWGVYQAPQPYYTSGGPKTKSSATQIASAANLFGISNAQASALLKTFSGKNTVGTISGLGSGEANLRHEFCRSANGHVDILFGFRAADLSEGMAAVNTQDVVLVTTQNVFLGGQLGIEGEFDYGRLFINGWGKFALGNNHETASAGSNTMATSGSSFSSFSGNQGSASRNEFTGLGEAGLAAGYQLGPNVRVFASYTIIYLNNAVRPGTQIGNFLGTSPSGMFSFMNNSFWAQGVGAGLEFRF